MSNKKMLIGVISALICETLFGFSYIFTKNTVQVAGEFELLGWRFFIAFVIMLALIVLGVIKINLKGKNIKPLLSVAIFSPCIYFIGETLGISRTTASESGVFLACIPVASLIASTLILDKKPSKIQVMGITITLIGVIITVAAVGISSSLSVVGYGFLLLAVFAYALYSVFVEKAIDYTEIEITFVMLAVGAIVFVFIAIVQAIINGSLINLIALPFKESSFAVAILYQGIGCSIMAFFLSNVAIANIGVNKTASFIGVATVVSIIAGALILHETFNIYQIFGAVMIIAGVYIANSKVKSIDKELLGE
ncbi:Permease of the drug/metabolite transporter (DMT) superfamily [Peptoniphilus asaccharolyticus DSM 20463]|uniref:Permease of the drug/metabolite transporter (DMT) superfamily n=1 Tax=Peptoniphilus asaccharolyticus DSM 20463 TaxID=573058 RepID=A0A1W1V3G4_PEPAS|nr:DMT family transporter [Peptoniphilus asaccharolyticus]MBL7576210.1 DMT family transporter [Peptoniphilus asaccharolyticus]SMB87838.1 Permease of the drug/metabolite transporter (DMT) superfamily [Peptoniphilus asaccharolyticus DSM 20463]